MTTCLDSWAVLAWLDGEQPATERVDSAIDDPDDQLDMSWVNAVEVYYRVERDHGRLAADEVLDELRTIIDLGLPGVSRMVEVAQLKARHPMALGDCFAVATAAARGATLLTGDPEIIDAADLPCEVLDLRP